MIDVNKFEVPEKPSDVTEPELGLIVHSAPSGKTFVTRHQFNNGQLGRGLVIKLDTVINKLTTIKHASMFRNARANEQTVDLLPEHVLINNDSTLAWHKPSRKAPMWFSTHIGIKRFDVYWPSIVYLVNKHTRQLNLCATSTKSRPTLSSRVYKAPIWNLGDCGAFCLGNATLPKDISIANIPAMEACVEDSQFTHRNGNVLLKQGSSDQFYFSTLQKMQRQNTRFRATDLADMPTKTLSDFINHFYRA